MLILLEDASVSCGLGLFFLLILMVPLIPFYIVGIVSGGLGCVYEEYPWVAVISYIIVVPIEILICYCLFSYGETRSGIIAAAVSLCSLHPRVMAFLISFVMVMLVLYVIFSTIQYLSYLRGFREFEAMGGTALGDDLCMSWFEYLFTNR